MENNTNNKNQQLNNYEITNSDCEIQNHVLFEISPSGILLEDESGNIIDVNPAYCNSMGYTRLELIGQNAKILTHPDVIDQVENNLHQIISGKTLKHIEKSIRKDGSVCFMRLNEKKIKLPDGSNGILCLAEDITEQKESEDALKASSEQLKSLLHDQEFLLNNIRDFVYRHDKDGVFYYLSPAIEQISGYKVDEWKKHYTTYLTDNPINNKVISSTETALKTGKTQPPYQVEIYHKKGYRVRLEVNERPYFKDGQVAGLIGVARDISERIKTEKALKDSEEKYRNIFQYSPLGILHFNEKGVTTNCNEEFIKIIGSSKEKLIGLDMLNQLNDEKLINAVKTALKTGIGYYEDEYHSVTAKKSTPVRAHFSAIYSTDKKIVGGVGIIEDITESVNAEKQIHESEERYRRLVELSPEAIAVHSEGKFVFVNDSAIKLIGAQRKEDLIGKPVLDFVHPDYKSMAVERIRRMLEDGKDVPLIEEKFIRLDGQIIDVEVKSIPIRFHGKPAVQVVTRDISHRKKAELSLMKKSQEFENLLKTARHLTESLEINNVLNKVATGAMEILNAASFCIYLLESDNETLKPVVAIDPDYEEEILSTPIKVNNSFTGQCVVSKCGLIFNETGEDSIGYQIPGTPEETEERLITVPFIVEEKVLGAMCISRMGDFFTEEELALAETYATYASAALKNAHLYNNLQQEVEERKRAQNVLYDLNIQYKSFIQNSMVGIWKLDFENPVPLTLDSIEIADHILNNGVFSECNDAFAQMYGFSSSKEIIGKHNSEFSVNPEESLKRLEQFVKNDFKTEIIDNEEIDNDGIIHNFRNSYFGVKDNGYLRWVWGIQIDITEQKKLEAQLFQSQKMEAIGTLAGGIAHDFNNLLTVINGHAEIGLMKIVNDNPLHKDIVSILHAGKRAENLTRQLLAFSRKQIYRPKILELNSLIEGLDKMLLRLIGEDIKMKKHLSIDNPKIKADPGQIEQIFINLIVNARDAINQKTDKAAEKTIIIETNQICLDEYFVADHEGSQTGWHVCFSVSDSGAGISAKIKEHIFEPFFTTKDKAHGTGLGLATVYGIVKQNNGSIYVYSEPDQGTTFKIYWPLSGGNQVIDVQEEKADKKVATGTETIFLVEDDNAVRNFASAALKDLGYTVFEAENGKEALEFMDKNFNSPQSDVAVDLLITDMIMPEMNGRELAAKLEKRFPETQILFASGYTNNYIEKNGNLEAGVNFIQKPFSVRELAEKVRVVLDNKIN